MMFRPRLTFSPRFGDVDRGQSRHPDELNLQSDNTTAFPNPIRCKLDLSHYGVPVALWQGSKCDIPPLLQHN